MTDAPKKLDRDVLEELICGAHDAMIVLDQIIDNIDECRLKEPDEWRVKVNLASLIESGTVILFLTKEQYRALDVAKIAAFNASRKAEEDFLASTGAIE